MKRFIDYIKESSGEEYQVGDRVEHDTCYDNFSNRNSIEPGTIIKIDRSSYLEITLGVVVLVKFDRRWGDCLHDADGLDGSSQSYWLITEPSSFRKEKIYKKSSNLLLDPYGEDDWNED